MIKQLLSLFYYQKNDMCQTVIWKSNLDFILPRKEGSQPAVGLNQMKKIYVTLRQHMNSSGITVCGICFMEDNMYTEVIDWLQCEICSIWVHRQCIKAPLLLNSDTFLCEHCT